MKKVIALCIAVTAAVFASSAAFAAEGPGGLTGMGVYGSVGNASGAMGGGLGISLKFGSFPVIGLQYNIAEENTRFNASIDYYAMDAEPLASHLTYFLGGGLYGGAAVSGDSDEADFDFGLRIPFGLQFWPVKKMELYLSPVLAIPMYPTPRVGFGLEFGGRLRF